MTRPLIVETKQLTCDHCGAVSLQLVRDTFTDDMVCEDKEACHVRMVRNLSPQAAEVYDFLKILVFNNPVWEIVNNDQPNH